MISNDDGHTFVAFGYKADLTWTSGYEASFDEVADGLLDAGLCVHDILPAKGDWVSLGEDHRGADDGRAEVLFLRLHVSGLILKQSPLVFQLHESFWPLLLLLFGLGWLLGEQFLVLILNCLVLLILLLDS